MANTTTTLSNEMMTYLEKRFLDRSVAQNIHLEGAQVKKHSVNSGKTVNFNRYTPATVTTVALTEATNPADTDIVSTVVSATVAEYGKWTKTGSLLNITSIDADATEKTDLMAQNANETLDTLGRDELFTGATTQFAAGRSVLTGITPADVLTSAEIRKAVRTLKRNNAMAFDDGYFLGKVGPDTAFDLMGDSTWVNAHTYKDGAALYKGELGKLHRVRFLECSSNQKSESSTVTVFSNFIHGKNAFGTVNLKGNSRLIVKNPSKGDTSNPLDMFITIGWKADAFAVKTLNPNWIINVKTAASA